MLAYPQIDPVALAIGPLKIHWYGLMYLIGIGGAWWLASRRLKAFDPTWTREKLSDLVFWVALGVIAGFVLYAGKDKDPVSIPLLRERFYIDRFYDNFVVRYFQNAFAAIVHFFDEFLINGVLVGGLSRSAEGFGNLFRRVQSGNLQGYAFAFGLGVLLVIYFTVALALLRGTLL